MAVLIPDSCPGKATQGEKRLYRLLEDHLPDNFSVWYEPEVDDRYPDFIVLADTFGLLAIETKGWYPAQLSRVSDQAVDLLITQESESRIERHKNPYRQVREYMFTAMNLLAREPLLRDGQGPYQGRLCFPCGCGVVFTNVTAANSIRPALLKIFRQARHCAVTNSMHFKTRRMNPLSADG